MTREEFWMQVYMASYGEFHDSDIAKRDANAALAAYDEALKKYGEACKDAPVWPKGSLPWAMAQMQLGDRFSDRLRRKECQGFPTWAAHPKETIVYLPLIHPDDAKALDWEVVE